MAEPRRGTLDFQARERFVVEARGHLAFGVDQGDLIRLTDPEGAQPIDFWAFNRADIYEHLSCEHTRPSIEKLFPRVGDAAYTTKRRSIVTLLEDNSPGQHDMEFAACDVYRYAELGWDEASQGRHANCTDNLHKGLADLGLALPYMPQPWNLFTNFFLKPDGTFEVRAPATQPGDNLILRAEMDAYLVVSACPQDMNATCGGAPTPILAEVGVVR